MKADLHMHGAIGFHEPWISLQGYRGKNLLEIIASKCMEKGIDICAITSHQTEIPRNSPHDRFGYLKNEFAPKLPKWYETTPIGDNVMLVSGLNGKRLYLVNGQTAIVEEEGSLFDTLVVGSNQVPNRRTFKETHDYCRDNGLIYIAEHPMVEKHQGMGPKRLLDLLDDFDAIEGHNAQLVLPIIPSSFPFFGEYSRDMNKKAQDFAISHDKPFVSFSDAHDLEGIGTAYIGFDDDLLSIDTDTAFISSLRDVIRTDIFYKHEEYQKFFSWLRWTTIFKFNLKKSSSYNP